MMGHGAWARIVSSLAADAPTLIDASKVLDGEATLILPHGPLVIMSDESLRMTNERRGVLTTSVSTPVIADPSRIH